MKYDTFPDDFIIACNDNANEDIHILIEVKNIRNRMAMEQGLYAQLVKIRQKDLEFIEENKNKNEAKFKLQGQSAISQRWFDLEFDLIEVHFSTHKPDFIEKCFQSHDDTQDTNIFNIFQVPIGN